jgi:cytosine/creatinine deaminase
MPTGFAQIPQKAAYALVDARVPASLLAKPDPALEVVDGLAKVDIVIAAGRVLAVTPQGATPADAARVELGQGVVLPGLVDAHTHLDKSHIWPRKPNPDGTFPGALEAVGADRRANWTVEDVLARMEFSLRAAHAHGTVAIRTHIDSVFGQEDITWPALPSLRERWKGRIELQFACLGGVDAYVEPGFTPKLARVMQEAGGILGCVTYMTPNLRPALEMIFAEAEARGLELDFHVDETQDPAAHSLRIIAETAIARRFQGRILVGHCCSIARQPEAERDRTLDLVAEAGLSVVSLPMCNMYLQDRHAGRTPLHRGVTLLHELKARGVRVLVASDNTRDPFYAYGDMDLLEVYREATRIAHFDHPVGDWPRTVAASPAEAMGLTARGLVGAGLPADLILTRARSWTELLSRPWSDRTVLRAGRPIDTTPPDYAELDPIVGAP